MKEGTKTRDVVGQPRGRSLFLGDPGAIFFCGKLGTGTKKEKRSKKERKRRPVETDAADGNPLNNADSHSGLESTKRFPQFPQARRRFHRGTRFTSRVGPNQSIERGQIKLTKPSGPWLFPVPIYEEVELRVWTFAQRCHRNSP